MSQELYWLTLTATMTALFWLPYACNRIVVRGLVAALGNPKPDAKPHAPWAERMMKAHSNATENLVIFAALVLTAQAVGISTELTVAAAITYFWARAVHFVVYALGIPGVRTLAFFVGFLAQMTIALTILGLL